MNIFFTFQNIFKSKYDIAVRLDHFPKLPQNFLFNFSVTFHIFVMMVSIHV